MYGQGFTIQGAKYGGVSPADFTGLAGWWRATEGITFANSSFINKWNDISGNNRHLQATVNATGLAQTSYGRLENTANGLGVTDGNSSGCLACLTDTAFRKMFYDGRPITVLLVFKINAIQSSTGYALISTGLTSANGLFTINAPTATLPIRTLNVGGSTIANNDFLNVFTVPGGHIVSVIDFGYDAALSFTHRKAYLDTVLKTQVKFSATPSAVVDSSFFKVQPGSTGNTIYEIIIYDNTGKSQTQITAEHSSLYTDYLLKRYPNLFL